MLNTNATFLRLPSHHHFSSAVYHVSISGLDGWPHTAPTTRTSLTHPPHPPRPIPPSDSPHPLPQHLPLAALPAYNTNTTCHDAYHLRVTRQPTACCHLRRSSASACADGNTVTARQRARDATFITRRRGNCAACSMPQHHGDTRGALVIICSMPSG